MSAGDKRCIFGWTIQKIVPINILLSNIAIDVQFSLPQLAPGPGLSSLSRSADCTRLLRERIPARTERYRVRPAGPHIVALSILGNSSLRGSGAQSDRSRCIAKPCHGVRDKLRA